MNTASAWLVETNIYWSLPHTPNPPAAISWSLPLAFASSTHWQVARPVYHRHVCRGGEVVTKRCPTRGFGGTLVGRNACD